MDNGNIHFFKHYKIENYFVLILQRGYNLSRMLWLKHKFAPAPSRLSENKQKVAPAQL